MTSSERQVLVSRSIDIVLNAIVTGLHNAGLDAAEADKLRKVEFANLSIDDVAKAAFEYANSDKFVGMGARNLIPSALWVQVGGGFDLAWGLGAGASGGIGVVFLPVKITRLDVMTQEVVEYYRVEYGLIGIGAGNVGTGAGAGAKFRTGLGLVWGPLESPNDFKGMALAISGDATLGPVGLNIKGGALKQWGRTLFLNNRINPFVLLQYQGGIAADANIRGNIMPIINLSGPLANMMKTALGEEPADTATARNLGEPRAGVRSFGLPVIHTEK